MVGSALGVSMLLVVACVFYRRRAESNAGAGVDIHESLGDKPGLEGIGVAGVAGVAFEIHGAEIHEKQSTAIHADPRWELPGIPLQEPVGLFAGCSPEVRDYAAGHPVSPTH